MRLSFLVATLAAAAIGHATASPAGLGPVVVSVEGRGLRAATGFVVAGDRVVTVAHAVGDGAIVVREAGGARRAATVVRRDDRLDLALLAVPGLEDERAAPGGDDLVATTPQGASARIVVRRDGATATVAANVRRRIEARVRNAATDAIVRRPALELAAAVGAGDSGAPAIGPDGRVVGVVFARSRDREGTAYAVDATALAAFLR